MKTKPNILKLETHEYLITASDPRVLSLQITYKGKLLKGVIAVVIDSRLCKLEDSK